LGCSAPLPAALPRSLPRNDEVYQIGFGSRGSHVLKVPQQVK
jgi:hypothetical protein